MPPNWPRDAICKPPCYSPIIQKPRKSRHSTYTVPAYINVSPHNHKVYGTSLSKRINHAEDRTCEVLSELLLQSSVLLAYDAQSSDGTTRPATRRHKPEGRSLNIPCREKFLSHWVVGRHTPGCSLSVTQMVWWLVRGLSWNKNNSECVRIMIQRMAPGFLQCCQQTIFGYFIGLQCVYVYEVQSGRERVPNCRKPVRLWMGIDFCIGCGALHSRNGMFSPALLIHYLLVVL